MTFGEKLKEARKNIGLYSEGKKLSRIKKVTIKERIVREENTIAGRLNKTLLDKVLF